MTNAKSSKFSESAAVAIVFGGAGGIGSAVVKEFLDRKLRVIIADKVKTADPELKRINKSKLEWVLVDVTDEASITKVCQGVKSKYGAIECLVSLAGGALPDEFMGIEKCGATAIGKSIDLNLKSHAIIVHKFATLFKTIEGNNNSIVLVSSINAVRGYGLPAYSAAKAGIIGLVTATAVELGQRGIRINAILPGTVMTPRTMKQPKDFDALKKGTALNRLATPSEIAQVIVSMSLDLTSVTGQSLIADCGQTIKVF